MNTTKTYTEGTVGQQQLTPSPSQLNLPTTSQPNQDDKRDADAKNQTNISEKNKESTIQSVIPPAPPVDNASNVKKEVEPEETKIGADTGQIEDLNPNRSTSRNRHKSRNKLKRRLETNYDRISITVPQPNKASKSRKNIGSTRRLWTKDEDEAITHLVKHYGIRKWTLISKKLQDKYNIYGRSGKQCRERYIAAITLIDGTTTLILR